jgi:hypothetical protein
MLNCLQKYKIVPHEINILIGCAGNGLSTSLRHEISNDPIKSSLFDCFSLVSLESDSILKTFTDNIEMWQKKELVVFDHMHYLLTLDNVFFYEFQSILARITQNVHGNKTTVVLVFDDFIDIFHIQKPALEQIFFKNHNLKIIPAITFQEIISNNKLMNKDIWQSLQPYTGGNPSLDDSVEQCLEGSGLDVNELLSRPAIQVKLSDIWDSIGPQNRQLLFDTFGNNEVHFSDWSAQFLASTKIYDCEKKQWGSILLKEYVRRLIDRAKTGNIITLSNGKIIDLSVMSDLQGKILAFLLGNDKKQVTREELAKVIWGDRSNEKYSDYAIDRHISDIRKLIGDREQKIIKTNKGIGYKICL